MYQRWSLFLTQSTSWKKWMWPSAIHLRFVFKEKVEHQKLWKLVQLFCRGLWTIKVLFLVKIEAQMNRNSAIYWEIDPWGSFLCKLLNWCSWGELLLTNFIATFLEQKLIKKFGHISLVSVHHVVGLAE